MKNEVFILAVKQIKKAGFRVFSPTSEKCNYGYFSDGKNIGYFQVEPFLGISLATMNGPGSRGCGTGFLVGSELVSSELTPEKLKETFITCPSWYRLEKNTRICKWKDLETFLTEYWNSKNLIEL